MLSHTHTLVLFLSCSYYYLSNLTEKERRKRRKWEEVSYGSTCWSLFSLPLASDPMPPIIVTATAMPFLFTPIKSVPFTIPGPISFQFLSFLCFPPFSILGHRQNLIFFLQIHLPCQRHINDLVLYCFLFSHLFFCLFDFSETYRYLDLPFCVTGKFSVFLIYCFI